MQSVMTTIPLRFGALGSESLSDQDYQTLSHNEFTHLKQDSSHRLLAKSFRYQSTLDVLGLEKSYWIEQVYQRFNLLTLFNYAFRECQ